MAAPSLSPDMFQSSEIGDLQELMLRTWELGSSERELTRALAIIAEILRPLLRFASFSLLCFEEGHARLHGLRDEGTSTVGAQQEVRPAEYESRPSLQRQRLSYDFAEVERRCTSRKPSTCPDLLARNSWYEHEFQLADIGIRSYASLPLIFQGRIVGSAIFGRSEPLAFETEELLILRGISPAISGVIANALESKRAGDRCIQLESENLELRSQIAQVPPNDALVFLRNRMDDAELDNSQSVLQSTQISTRLKEEERRLIEAALHSTHGRISGPKGAALRLGMPSSTLEFRIRRLGIDKFQYRRGCQE
jgi:transcriptional regulator with GAF, ATPase, and Fis domain